MLIRNALLTAIAAAAVTACGPAATNTANNTRTVNNANVDIAPVNSATPVHRSNSNVSREDYDRDRAEYEREKGSSTIGQGVNDSWLWFKTKTALAAADNLRDSTINVDVVNDVITLKGTVASAAQKTEAETVAKGIEGQKGVKNDLQIKANDSMTNQMVNGNTAANSNTNKR